MISKLTRDPSPPLGLDRNPDHIWLFFRQLAQMSAGNFHHFKDTFDKIISQPPLGDFSYSQAFKQTLRIAECHPKHFFRAPIYGHSFLTTRPGFFDVFHNLDLEESYSIMKFLRHPPRGSRFYTPDPVSIQINAELVYQFSFPLDFKEALKGIPRLVERQA